MAKLGEQVALATPQRMTRTQRLVQRREREKETIRIRKGVELAQQKLSTATSIDDYENKYNQIPTEFQRYFQSPEQLREKQRQEIQKNMDRADERIQHYKDRIEKKKQDIDRYKQWWSSKNDKYRSREHNRENYEERLDDYDKDIDEAQYYVNYWGEAKGRYLSKGYGYGDADGWVDQNVRYRMARKEARRRALRQKNELERKLRDAKPEDIHILTEYKNGKVVGRKIYIDTGGKKWELIGSQKPTAVPKGAKPSDIGKVRFKSSVEVGGQKITFPTTAQVYEKGGKFYTPFSEIKITQERVPDLEALKELQKPSVIYSDYKPVDTSTHGYVTRGTKTDQPRQEFVLVTPPKDKPKSKIVTKVKEVWESIPSGDLYLNLPRLPRTKREAFFGTGVAGISMFKTSDDAIHLRGLKEATLTKLDEKSQKLVEQEITTSGLKGQLDTQYAQEYEARFYRSEVGKKAFLGEIDFAEAEKQFAESDTAKVIQEKYRADIQEGRAGKFTKEGFQIAGISYGKRAIQLVPTTTKGAVAEGVLIYSGYKLLSAVPTITLNTVTAGVGTVGLAKGLSPTASPEEKASGLITAGVSGAILGVQGVRYLRQPTIKTVKIKVPKPTVKASSSIGRDIKVITKTGEINKVVYGHQKLTQTAIAGRRTVVSTRFRDLVKLDPVYRGVPYAQRGVKYAEGFRGIYKFPTKTGYQKAFDLLTKRAKYSPYQAQQTLRYVQPKFIEQYLSKGVLTVEKGRAVGEFTYLTKQPSFTIDKALGIKTRGSATITDLYNVQRKLITLKRSGTPAVLEFKQRLAFTSKAGKFKFKRFEVKEGVIFGKVGDVQKGYEFLGRDPYSVSVFQKANYKVLASSSVERGVIPFDKTRVETILKNPKNWDFRKAVLYGREIDLTKVPATKQVANIQKTPISKTFAPTPDPTAIKRTLRSMTGTADAKTVKTIVNQIEQSKTVYQSDYYGKGLYERTAGGQLPPETTAQIKSTLSLPTVKTGVLPKTILKVGGASRLLPSLAVGNILLSRQTLDQSLNLKLDTRLKAQLKEKVVTKVELVQKQALKQSLRSDLDLGIDQPIVPRQPPTPPPPIIPKLPTPLPPVKFPSAKKKKKKREDELVDSLYERAYLPDFTTRIAGLEAVKVSKGDAQKLVKKVLTGLEVRRGVRVK